MAELTLIELAKGSDQNGELRDLAESLVIIAKAKRKIDHYFYEDPYLGDDIDPEDW